MTGLVTVAVTKLVRGSDRGLSLGCLSDGGLSLDCVLGWSVLGAFVLFLLRGADGPTCRYLLRMLWAEIHGLLLVCFEEQRLR